VDIFQVLAIPTAQGNIFMVWIALLWIFSFPIGVIFFKHRKEYPIAGRHPWLVLVAVFFFLIFVTVVCLERAYPAIYECSAFIGITVAIFGMALYVMFLRVWVVFFMFKSTAERARKSDKGWFISHRWMVSQNLIRAGVVLGFALLVGVAIAIDLSTRTSTDSGLELCAGRNAVFIFMACEVLFVGAFFVVFALLLRNTAEDNLYLKKELFFLSVACFVAVAAFLPLSLIEETRAYARTDWSFSAMVCAMTGMAVVAISWMYPLGKLHLPDVNAASEKETLSLYACLDHPDGRESFREFLITEFSVENILVLDDIGYYKDMVKAAQQKQGLSAGKGTTTSVMGNLGLAGRGTTADAGHVAMDVIKGGDDREKVLHAAMALYKRYVVPGAPDQVNLPSSTVVAMNAAMSIDGGADEVYNGSVFDQVKLDIEALCRRDSFPRYCRSPQGKEFKLKIGLQQATQARRSLLIHFLKLLGLCCAGCCAAFGSICAFFG
jgi:hypothetical protein